MTELQQDLPRSWRMVALAAGLSSVLALVADLRAIASDYRLWAVLVRSGNIAFFAWAGVVALLRPIWIQRYGQQLVLWAMCLITGTVSVLGVWAGGVQSLYFFGVIQAEIGAALFFAIPRRPFGVAVVAANAFCIAALCVGGNSSPAELSNAATTLVICALLVLGGHSMMLRYRTESAERQKDLMQSRRELESLVSSIKDAFFLLGTDWHFRYLNDEAQQLLGRASPSDVHWRTHTIWDMFPRLAEDSLLKYKLEQVMHERATVSFVEFYPLLNQHLLIRAFPTQDGLSVLCSDISGRVRAEQAEQAQVVSTRMEAARENERRRISREIHDQLGQSLAALKLDLSMLRSAVPIDRQEPEKIMATMEQTLHQTLESTRRIAADLRPTMLDDLGLKDAIEWQVQQIAERAGLDFTVRVPDSVRAIPAELCTAIFRIVQESLTNIVKHAQASMVEVTVAVAPAYIEAVIRDDGVGLEGSARQQRQGLGLVGMAERAREHGGTVEMSSSQGQGTTIRVYFPREVALEVADDTRLSTR